MSQSKLSVTDNTEKKFVIKHVFKDVMNVEKSNLVYEPKVAHCNFQWTIMHTLESDGLYLDLEADYDQISKKSEYWEMETEIKVRMLKGRYESHTFFIERYFSELFSCQVLKRIDTEDVDKFIIDDDLSIEIHVKIVKVSGIENQKSIDFGEMNQEFSDVVLVVGDQKFHLIKKFLAFHSTYFQSLFSEYFAESQKAEIELKDIDAQDFQNFLELIHGESEVKDSTVDGILNLADFFDSKIAMKRCEGFLMEKSTKLYTEKFKIAVKYNLEKLKEKCLPELRTADDIRSILPEDVRQFDYTVWNELLLKALDLSK